MLLSSEDDSSAQLIMNVSESAVKGIMNGTVTLIAGDRAAALPRGTGTKKTGTSDDAMRSPME